MAIGLRLILAKRVYNLVARKARASREPRVVLARCKIRGPINLWIYAWCPLITWCRVTSWSIFRFRATRQHRLCCQWPERNFMNYSCRLRCVYSSSIKQCLRSVNHEQWHRTTSTISGWKCSPVKILLAQRRQRRQHSDHKHVQRQRQNTKLQMKPMKRGNTDCWRSAKSDEEIRQRLHFTVKLCSSMQP